MEKTYKLVVSGHIFELKNYADIWWMNYMDFKKFLGYNINYSISSFCTRHKMASLLKDHTINLPHTDKAGRTREMAHISTKLAFNMTDVITRPKYKAKVDKIRLNKAQALYEKLYNLIIHGHSKSTDEISGIPGACTKKEPKKLDAKKAPAPPVKTVSVKESKLEDTIIELNDELRKAKEQISEMEETIKGCREAIKERADERDKALEGIIDNVEKIGGYKDLIAQLKKMAGNGRIPDNSFRQTVWALIVDFEE